MGVIQTTLDGAPYICLLFPSPAGKGFGTDICRPDDCIQCTIRLWYVLLRSTSALLPHTKLNRAGITIRSGTMLLLAGPGGAVIIYAIACFLGWALMGPFVEMSSVIPVTGPVWELPALFIDTTLGGTLGYMLWYVLFDILSRRYQYTNEMEKRFMYLTIYADEIGVTARLFRFDYGNEPRLNWTKINGVDSIIWAALTLVTSSAVNLLPVRVRTFFQLLRYLIMNECI